MNIHDPENPAASGGALESAISALERSLCADGPIDGGIPEGEHAGYQWRELFDWAAKNGLVCPAEVTPARPGGREHDVTFLESERRWRKFTKPDGCGYTVEIAAEPVFIPATPLQYLERLRLQNEFWGDDINLDGVQVRNPGARIVTSQPDIRGEAPSPDILHKYLSLEFDFQRLNLPPMGYYKSASYLFGNMGMFDVHPANFVETPKGIIVPIDVIMIRFSGEDLEILRRFV